MCAHLVPSGNRSHVDQKTSEGRRECPYWDAEGSGRIRKEVQGFDVVLFVVIDCPEEITDMKSVGMRMRIDHGRLRVRTRRRNGREVETNGLIKMKGRQG